MDPGIASALDKSGPDPAYYFLGFINDSDICDDVPPWMVELEVSGTDLNFKIDSGADVNQYVRIFSHPQLNTCNARLDSISGPIDCDGVFMAMIR